MATDSTKVYPLPKFHFQVTWGKGRMGFTEICGLEFETEVIDYREGNNPKYNNSKQPGLTKYSNITMKRGVFLGDFDMYDWWLNTYYFMEQTMPFRRDVTIQLLSEVHQPIITWNLANAWPCKVKYGSLNSEANDVLIESMELVHEGLTIVGAS
jgi:phage tail-like protein